MLSMTDEEFRRYRDFEDMLKYMSQKDYVLAETLIMKFRLDLEEANYDFSKLNQSNYPALMTELGDWITCSVADKWIGFMPRDGEEVLFEATQKNLQDLENMMYEFFYSKSVGLGIMGSIYYKAKFRDDDKVA